MKSLTTYINEKMVYNSSTRPKPKNINYIPETLDELKSKIKEEIEICNRNKTDYLDLSGYNLHKLESIEYIFEETLGTQYPFIKIIDVTNWNVSSIKFMTDTFCDCEHIEEIIGLETWDTSNATDMSSFFMNCENLLNFDISNFNFSKVERLGFFFSGCISLTYIDDLYIDCPNCISMSNMFSRCTELKTIDVSNINTNNCEIISGMFQHCMSLNKITGLENWDISNMIIMDNFLNGCTELKEANGLEKWKLTDKLKEAKTMFGYCSNLVIDLSNWTIDRSKINAINMCLKAIKMKKPKFINK